MRYIIYILLIGSLFSQDIDGDSSVPLDESLYSQDEVKTYTFTEEEVLGFTNRIMELELKDSLNVSLVGDLESQLKLVEENSAIDSMLIVNKTMQLNLLKDTNKLL